MQNEGPFPNSADIKAGNKTKYSCINLKLLFLKEAKLSLTRLTLNLGTRHLPAATGCMDPLGSDARMDRSSTL